MKKLIIRLTGAMAVAITLVLTGSGPLCAQSPPRAALTLFDLTYQYSLLKMQIEAQRVGLRIDTDIDVLVKARSHVLLATIDGFENIVLDEEGRNEFDFGFVGVAGIEGLRDGYYRLHCVIDFRHPEDDIAYFIDSHGGGLVENLDVFIQPVTAPGPRKGLAIEGGTFVAISGYLLLNHTGTASFTIDLVAPES